MTAAEEHLNAACVACGHDFCTTHSPYMIRRSPRGAEEHLCGPCTYELYDAAFRWLSAMEVAERA